MADFMVGWNTYYNGMNQGYKPDHSSIGGLVPGSKETDETGKSPRGEKAQRKEETQKDGFRKKEPGEECQTCKNRKYKDGSDENVSFKAAAHISPEAAASRVRAHEEEHVANAYSKAEQKGGEVLSVSVRIETSICPECGKSYVSGGTTSTRIRYPADSQEAQKQKDQTDFGNAARGDSSANTDTEIQRQTRRNPYAENQRQVRANAVRGTGFDHATRPLEEFEMERY